VGPSVGNNVQIGTSRGTSPPRPDIQGYFAGGEFDREIEPESDGDIDRETDPDPVLNPSLPPRA